jgi:ADP-heptose:LPS heptosyltransferase
MKVPMIKLLQQHYGTSNVYITLKNATTIDTVSTLLKTPKKNLIPYNSGLSTFQKLSFIAKLLLLRIDTCIVPFNINLNLAKKLSKLIRARHVITHQLEKNHAHKAIEFVRPLTQLNILEHKDVETLTKQHFHIDTTLPCPIDTLPENCILIHAGSGPIEIHKRYPETLYATVLDTMIERYPEHTVCLLGSTEELETNKDILQHMSHANKVLDLTNKLTFLELCALMQSPNVKALVSTDSGPSHVASIMGLPIISLFGPTHFELTGPFMGATKVSCAPTLECMPCYGSKEYGIIGCGNNVCMQKIEPGQILDALSSTLNVPS